jgi:hypothetical protein
MIEPNTERDCPDQSFKKSECRQRLLGFGFVIVSSTFYDPFAALVRHDRDLLHQSGWPILLLFSERTRGKLGNLALGSLYGGSRRGSMPQGAAGLVIVCIDDMSLLLRATGRFRDGDRLRVDVLVWQTKTLKIGRFNNGALSRLIEQARPDF